MVSFTDVNNDSTNDSAFIFEPALNTSFVILPEHAVLHIQFVDIMELAGLENIPPIIFL